MGLFSSLLGNAGAVNPEELYKQYGLLLCDWIWILSKFVTFV